MFQTYWNLSLLRGPIIQYFNDSFQLWTFRRIALHYVMEALIDGYNYVLSVVFVQNLLSASLIT